MDPTTVGPRMSSDGDGGELTTAEALKLLADGERRHILKELRNRAPDDGIDLQEAETLLKIAQQTRGEPADSGGDADVDVEQLEVELRHNHLPRLAERNVIEWDETSGAITRGPAFERISLFIEILDEHSDELPDDW